jgi:hypothetical protein
VISRSLAYSEKKLPSSPTQYCGYGGRLIVVVTHDGVVELDNTIPCVTNAEAELGFLEKIRQALWVVKDKQVGVLGLAFKANTDDIRFAPSLEVIRRLLAQLPRFSGSEALFSITYDFFRHYVR